MVMTRSKRAKRILRCLSAAQHEDHNLSGSVTPLIRYNLLHDYHRCIQVSVELGASTDRFPTAFSFGAMPNFLRSQLEAQKIADGSRLWSQVVPLLTFIHANLRRFEKSRGFPTLFTWHSRENHRSYFFFAFVEIRMVSKIYTARELLRLRKASAGKDFYHRLLDKLRRDTGLGEIFRVQPGGGSLPLIKEEDVAVSDKANPGLAKNAVPRQLDGTDSEWKYRGRIEYEEDTAHPICGPAGFSAQKDEGFQRFYKAVVSPTHVRVTAGGRIVPNTRGSSSPTAKWSKDKTPSDAAATSKGAGREQLEHFPFPIPQASFGAYPPMIPGFAPGMAAAHASFPMMPWHIGVNMGGAFGMVHPQMASMSMAGSMSSAVSLKSDKQSETGNSDTANSVRISPPEQFDHNRPFFYNGQWMMPHGAAMFPLGMPPIAGYSVPMAGQAIMHPRYGMHPMMNIHAMRSDSSPYSQTAPAPGASTHVGASPPPISSIRQSEITKRQLENLRSHLRFLEDQLQYNRHQIDEKLMEQQTQVLRQQIHLFEKNLEAQLTAEESQNSKAENTEESVSSASSRDGFGPKSSAASDCKPGKDSNSASGSRDDTPQARPVHEQKSANSIAAQPPPAPASSAKPAPLKSALKKPRATEPTKKASALPVSAALAPPFQPRIDSATPAPVTTGSSLFPVLPLTGSEPCHQNKEAKDDDGKQCIGNALRGFSSSTDTDFMCARDLTEDDAQARHMYWSEVPRSLPRGYAKFGGKSLLQPSPVKNGSSESETASSPSSRRCRIPTGDLQADFHFGMAKAESDPFGSVGRGTPRPPRGNVTQSESLPRIPGPVTPTPVAPRQSPKKGASQAGRSYEDFRKALAENGRFSSSSNEKSASDSGDESNILFKGRRVGPQNRSRNANEIWQNMLKKGKSSGTAVPGTVSSTVAQGVLPNYAGHATASLTPAIANTAVSPKGSSRKPGESGDAGPASQDGEKVENRPSAGTKAKGSLRRAAI